MMRPFTPLSKLVLTTVLGLSLTACGGGVSTDAETGAETVTPEVTAPEAPATVTLAEVIADPRRADDAARDKFRNPKETLEFFEIGEGQRVAEIWPGWYTKIIAPYLADKNGSYVAVLYPDGLSEGLDARMAAFKETYSDTSVYGTVDYAAFMGDAESTTLTLEDNSVDTILTFRNVHNWMGRGFGEEAFAEFYRALKPGGILGVVEHRLPETRTQDPKAASGYVQESYMKALASEAGFEFVASSEVNANPLDTADHPMGVWTLPPRSRLPKEGSVEAQDFDADAYKNIGESDRATLKFRKPE